jgi:adenylosuccinate lyase
LIFQQRALDLILPKLAKVIQNLQQFSLQHKDLPTLGFTHYQAVSFGPACLLLTGLTLEIQAQLITVGMMPIEGTS